MKKRISVILVLAVAFVSTLTVIGCTNNRVYYTEVGRPDYVADVSVFSNGVTSNDSKGGYVIKGENVKVLVVLERGYALGTLKMFLNGEEFPLVAESANRDNVSYATQKPYTASEQLEVKFTGEPQPITANAVLSITPFFEKDAELMNDVFIEVSGTEGVCTLKEYMQKSVAARTLRIKANEGFTVFIYTEGYAKVPFNGNTAMYLSYIGDDQSSYSRVQGGFVAENNRYGYKYNDTLFANATLDFGFVSGGYLEINMNDVAADNATRQMPLQSNGLFELKVNGESRRFNEFFTVPFYFEDFDNNQEVELSLVFNESANGKMDAIVSGLEFKVSLSDTPVVYTVNGNTVTMELKRPIEYAADPSNQGALDAQYVYRYYIKTNLLQKIEAAGLTLKDEFMLE